MDKEKLIGRKAKGFEFIGTGDDYDYVQKMDGYIGKVGKITEIKESNIKIDFGDECWWYPLSMIEEHLIPEKWWVRFTGNDIKDQNIIDWFNKGIGQEHYGLKDRKNLHHKGLVYPSKQFEGIGDIFLPYSHLMDNNRLIERYTEISYEQFLEITGQKSLSPVATNEQVINIKQEKAMNVVKTKTIKVNGLDREVTVAVVVGVGKKLTAGYSVKNPEDKENKELANTIAIGRASKEKTAIDTEMYITQSMEKKFILYAVVDNIFNQIEKGSIAIKGVK